MDSNQHDNTFNLIRYCVLSTMGCFIIAWWLLPKFLGFGETRSFTSDWMIPSMFLSLVPGIIIGSMIYFIKRSEENKSVSSRFENVPRERADVNSQPKPSLSDQLREIKKLHEEGILSEEEFHKLKKEILRNN